MKPYKLIHETSDHFILHNGKAHFRVAKSGISEPTADKIRSLADGGNVGPQTPYEAGIEAVEKKKDVLENAKISPEQSNEEIQIEAAEKKRRAQPAKDYIQENNPELKDKENPLQLAKGGKLDAKARAHISEKNFAGPDRSYPIENASHARNALARVSQHGSPELQARVRAKVHAKYPGIEQSHAEGGSVPYRKPEKYDEGGTVDIDPDKAQSISDSFKGAVHSFDDGGEVDQGLWDSIKKAFKTPEPTPAPTPVDKDEEIRRRSRLSVTDPSNPEAYAGGGPVQSNAVKDISNETQEEAIGRYAAGNPANLSKGGHIHHNAGKNQVHLHFYDGAVVPSPLDRETGGGKVQQATPLDKYVNLADPSGDVGDEAASQEVPTDSEKLTQAAQDIQAGLSAQEPGPATSTGGTYEAAPIIPPSQQVSAAPKSLPTTPDQSPNMLNEFDKSLALEKTGIEQGAAAQSKGYQDTARAIGENLMQQKAAMDAYKLEADKITQQNDQLFHAVASSKVDPNHFWNSKTTGGKIMATIGVLLGGIGGGANGTNQNQALITLQNHIQQDIEAQKLDQSNKMNLYKMGLERYRNAQSAQQFATLQSNALLQGQLQKIAASTGNQQAQATAQQLIGQLGVQNAGIRNQLAIQQAALGAMNQPPQNNVDPNKMRLLINAGVIPKEEVPTAMKEFGDFNKLRNSLDEVDNVFNQAKQDSTYTQRVAEGIPGGSMLPTFRDSTKKFQAETNALLDKYTKDLTGRVTPQSMQNLRHSIPLAGDSPEVFNRKLQSFKDIVREAYTFPTLESYRLVNPNNSVSQSTATRKRQFTESKPK